MLAVWRRSPETAANMLCSTVPEKELERIVGGRDIFRYILYKKSCIIRVRPNKTDHCLSGECDDRLTVQLTLSGYESLSDQLKAAQQHAVPARLITVAGRPAMQQRTNYGGTEGDQSDTLAIAVHGDMNKPGVLSVDLHLQPPRGAPLGAATDTSRLKIRDTLATAILKGAFP